jgi:dolichol-phosphate mannosyltransferase
MPTISFALPVFNEETGIETFHAQLSESVAARPDVTCEFVYVNDGSRDASLDQLMAMQQRDPRIRIVDLSRNFGHQLAITAGIEHATGDAVIVMDTDLQDPPDVALQLIAVWENGADVVYAQRRNRDDRLFKRATASLYYRSFKYLADVEIPRDTGDFRLMSRQVVNEFLRHRERNRFIRGLVPSLGFRQESVQFDRGGRFAGETKYPLSKMLKLAADGITSLSAIPLKFITRLGILSVLIAVAGIAYAVVLRLFFPDVALPGFSLTLVAILFMGGVQMLSLGVIGSYIGRIYAEVQDRPLYIVRRVLNMAPQQGAAAAAGLVREGPALVREELRNHDDRHAHELRDEVVHAQGDQDLQRHRCHGQAHEPHREEAATVHQVERRPEVQLGVEHVVVQDAR